MSKSATAKADEEWTVTGLRGRTRELAPVEEADSPPEDDIPPKFPTRRGMLSQAELEMLLRPNLDDMEPEPEAEPEPTAAAMVVRDEGSPDADFDLFDEDAPRKPAELAADARKLATHLTAALRRKGVLPISFEAAPVEAKAAQEGVFLVFECTKGEPVASLCLDAGLAGALIEAMCGGPVEETSSGVKFSRLALRLLRDAMASAAEAVGAVAGQAVTLSRIETETRFAGLSGDETSAERFGMRAVIGGLTGQAVLRAVAAPKPEVPAIAAVQSPISGLETTLQVRLCRLEVPVSRVSKFEPGQTLLLGIPTDQPVELMAGKGDAARSVAEARMGRKGKFKAVRLSRIRRG